MDDPCGPPLQAPLSSETCSTCHKNVTVTNTTSPLIYGITCSNDPTREPLNTTGCANAMISICYTMAGFYGLPATDAWVVTPNQSGNCTFGFWLPKGGAPPPSYARCGNQIFGVSAGTCMEPGFNVGSVNLRELPSAGALNVSVKVGEYGTGMPVDGAYPSYVMVAQKRS